MKTDNTIPVLLLVNEFNRAQIVLEESHASTGLDISAVSSGEELRARLPDTVPAVIVVDSDGIGDLLVDDVLSWATEVSPEIPVVVLGRDGEDGHDALRFLREGAADYIPVSHIERLPLAIRRAQREKEMLLGQRQLHLDLQKAYDATLENQKLMAIGRLAGSIAHEINNPLEAVTNLLYLARMEPGLSENAQNYLFSAEQEMERVAQITKQTLNFYRETRTPVRVKASELLEEVLVLYSQKIGERQIEVIRQYRSDAGLLVFPGEIRQVLSNLVTNAIEASSTGGKLILRIQEARKWSDEGIRGIRISIADNGCGIAAATRKHLGELFYTTKGQRGTGLGLWVSRAIVKRYGGEIQLYSSIRERRRGTVFSVFMPTNLRPHAVITGAGGGDAIGFRVRQTGTGDLLPEACDPGAETARARNYRRQRPPSVAS